LFPDELSLLAAHFERHGGFLDPGVHRFYRELQFYVSYREHTDPMRAAGLTFCYPGVDAQSKEELSEDTFDLSLASMLLAEGGTVVTNDFRLDPGERILVVSGPNQGGKTTFARTFGQLHHLAAIGVPVPGRRARLYLCDRIFTHFEREEELSTLTGKLETDLVEMQRTLRSATPRSVVIMNEVFSSTSLEDARFLGTEAMRRLVDLDCLAVYVTFIDELASFAPSVVSMISTIVPEDPATRTFKVVRAPANGLAYALSLAQKHRLTYPQLLERIS
ncbi:MAG: MutS-related protein, partial [Acidimicrobiales bacterium]